MKKILFVAPFNTGNRYKGGISLFAQTIIDNKDDFQHLGILFFPFNNCLVNRRPESRGKLNFKNIVNLLKTRSQISKTIKKGDYDSIYINSSFGLGLLKDLFTLKKKYKKTCHVYLHIHFADVNQVLTNNKIIRRLILKKIRSKISTCITLSNNLKKELTKIGFDAEKIQVLANYYSPDLPVVTKNDIIVKNKDNDCVKYLFIGSIDQRKGFYDLIEAFQRNNISQRNKLIICGKPNDNSAKIIIKQLENNSMFVFKGYVEGEEKYSVFKEADVLILPSYGEGLPLVILEALRFGLPVISTNVGAIPEIINDNIGTLIKPGDINGLKNTIEQYNLNKEMILSKSLNCIEESKKYTFENFKNNLSRIISENL